MAGIRLMVALLIGAATGYGFDGQAAADDGSTDANQVALTTCSTTACQLTARTPGQAASEHGQSADTPTCMVVPVANHIERKCYVSGRLVSSQVLKYTVEASAPPAAVLARQAYKKLVPPQPLIQMSPAVGLPQLTGLPVWLWLPSGSWVPTTSTVSAGAVTVKATATPQRVLWSLGDGTAVTCSGPGTPYPDHPGPDGTAASPTCGHTYHRTSATEPGGEFHATATIVWQVDWTGSGPGGTFPDVESSVGFSVRVVEAAALVTNSH